MQGSTREVPSLRYMVWNNRLFWVCYFPKRQPVHCLSKGQWLSKRFSSMALGQGITRAFRFMASRFIRTGFTRQMQRNTVLWKATLPNSKTFSDFKDKYLKCTNKIFAIRLVSTFKISTMKATLSYPYAYMGLDRGTEKVHYLFYVIFHFLHFSLTAVNWGTFSMQINDVAMWVILHPYILNILVQTGY